MTTSAAPRRSGIQIVGCVEALGSERRSRRPSLSSACAAGKLKVVLFSAKLPSAAAITTTTAPPRLFRQPLCLFAAFTSLHQQHPTHPVASIASRIHIYRAANRRSFACLHPYAPRAKRRLRSAHTTSDKASTPYRASSPCRAHPPAVALHRHCPRSLQRTHTALHRRCHSHLPPPPSWTKAHPLPAHVLPEAVLAVSLSTHIAAIRVVPKKT